MKVEKEYVNVQRSKDFEEQTFRIKANAHAFDILSSKLYSDVHLAIIRELSTNAWDAHQDAGTTKRNFEVHLPNKMEPFFFIRDFGTGMSHQDVMQLYTTYFESTKTSTNDQVGCLGLGSKSPFAYTDNFSITSWFQGKKRVYSMFKGEEGFPKVALMQTIDSDEASGIEVRFACKIEDINLFLEKAKVVYRKFPTKPIFRGNSRFDIEEREIEFRGDKWKIYRHKRDNNKSYAVMGCIGYPIKIRHLSRPSRELLDHISIDMDFPIGSLEIAASREELQYSEKTKKELQARLDKARKELASKVSEKFENCGTLWEARCLYGNLFGNYYSPLRHLADTVGKEVTWQHKNVYQSYSSSQSIDRCGYAISYDLTKQKNGVVVRRKNNVTNIQFRRNTALIINDTDKKPGEKIASWIKFGPDKIEHVYLIELNAWDKAHEECLHSILGTNASIFKPLSSLPKPVRKAPTRSKITGTVGLVPSHVPIYCRGMAFDETQNYYSYQSNNLVAWNAKDLDIAGTTEVYVLWRKGLAERKGGYWNPRKLKNILEGLEAIGKKPPRLYGVKAGYAVKFAEKAKGWKLFQDYAEECLEEFIKTNQLADQIKISRGAKDIEDFKTLKEVAKRVTKFSKLKRFINLVLSTENMEGNIKKAVTLAEAMNYPLEKGSLKDLADEVWNRYPMLRWINHGYYRSRDDTRYEDAARYVELIDTKRGKKCQKE